MQSKKAHDRTILKQTVLSQVKAQEASSCICISLARLLSGFWRETNDRASATESISKRPKKTQIVFVFFSCKRAKTTSYVSFTSFNGILMR